VSCARAAGTGTATDRSAMTMARRVRMLMLGASS
jgi:hypothetical protein